MSTPASKAEVTTLQSLIVATAGHVDHGKSSLVKNITGVETDTLKEEKARGLTINLGFAYHQISLELADGNSTDATLGFVDVPGHTDFINNMLAGVSSIDCALLIIAADDGVMPQTREHLAILDLLGVTQAVVALTKIDRVSDDLITQRQAEINQLLAGTSLYAAPVIAVSNLSNTGVNDVLGILKAFALQKIESVDTDSNNAASGNYCRYLIDRCFSVKGIGTVVTGSVKAGVLSEGASLTHSASGELSKAKGLRLDQSVISQASPGQRVAVHINIPTDKINRGDWLTDPQLSNTVTRLDCRLRFVDELATNQNIKTSAQYHLYIGASHRIVNLHGLDEESCFYQIKSKLPLNAHHGDRFILRDPASEQTIGGGEVLDTYIPRRGKSSKQRIAVLKALDNNNEIALAQLLALSDSGLNVEQFKIGRNINEERFNALLATLKSRNIDYYSIACDNSSVPVLLSKANYNGHVESIINQLDSYHKENPKQQGTSEALLSKSVEFAGSHHLFHGILDKLIKQERVKRSATILHLPHHKAQLSDEERYFTAKIRPVLLQAGLVAPRTRELEEMLNLPLKPLEKILKTNTKMGQLIQVAVNRYYLPETIKELAGFTEQLLEQQAGSEGFSVIQFRDASSIGRNLCIEILEYFDSVGFTRREDNKRFIRTDKENIFG